MSGPARSGPSDEDLLARFCNGESRCFEDLVRRYQTPLFNFILRSVRHRAVAEEVLQDAWLRIVQGAAGFQQTAKFSTWAYTVARNLCIDHARKAALRNHPSLDQPAGKSDDGVSLGELLKDPRAVVDRDAISRQLQIRLAGAIDALPEDQREVFVLREYAGVPFKDIGDIVGAPENTVKSRMRYALERLQEALADYEDYAQALGNG